MQEVEWRVGDTPSFHERNTTALDGYIISILGSPYLGVPKEVITKEVFQWLTSVPDIAKDSMRIMRYTDEFVSYEVSNSPKHYLVDYLS